MREFQRIVVVATQQIGDVLLTTPLIRAARERWPRAHIDVLGFSGTLGMLKGNPDVAELIEVRRGEGWRERRALLARLWRRYDLALITRGSDRAHLYGWLAARTRSGIVPLNDKGRWWKRRLLAHVVDEAADAHTVLEKLRLLSPWVDIARLRPQVVPPAPAPLPEDLQRLLGPRPIVVHVPSMWRYKQWPIEHFKTLVAALLADGDQVVLTGGPNEGDRALVASVAALGSAPQLLDVAGRLDLNQLATVLHGATLYIGPDTAITHLAAACETPSIALFGPTPPTNWGPWPAAHASVPPYERRAARQVRLPIVLLQGPGSCVPCGRAGCEDHRDSRSDCLQQLDPQWVLQEARALLASTVRA
jgi:heptosyltransferase-3